MKIPPVVAENIVSLYTRQHTTPEAVHNIVVTHKEINGSQRIEEIVKIYDRRGQIKEIGQQRKLDIMA